MPYGMASTSASRVIVGYTWNVFSLCVDGLQQDAETDCLKIWRCIVCFGNRTKTWCERDCAIE